MYADEDNEPAVGVAYPSVVSVIFVLGRLSAECDLLACRCTKPRSTRLRKTTSTGSRSQNMATRRKSDWATSSLIARKVVVGPPGRHRHRRGPGPPVEEDDPDRENADAITTDVDRVAAAVVARTTTDPVRGRATAPGRDHASEAADTAVAVAIPAARAARRLARSLAASRKICCSKCVRKSAVKPRLWGGTMRPVQRVTKARCRSNWTASQREDARVALRSERRQRVNPSQRRRLQCHRIPTNSARQKSARKPKRDCASCAWRTATRPRNRSQCQTTNSIPSEEREEGRRRIQVPFPIVRKRENIDTLALFQQNRFCKGTP